MSTPQRYDISTSKDVQQFSIGTEQNLPSQSPMYPNTQQFTNPSAAQAAGPPSTMPGLQNYNYGSSTSNRHASVGPSTSARGRAVESSSGSDQQRSRSAVLPKTDGSLLNNKQVVLGKNQVGLRITDIAGFDSRQMMFLGHAKYKLVVEAWPLLADERNADRNAMATNFGDNNDLLKVPVASSATSKPGNQLDFSDEVLVIDSPDRFSHFELALEEEGFFSTEAVVKTPKFDLQHSDLVLGQPVKEYFMDAKSGRKTPASVSFTMMKGGVDPLSSTVLQSSRGPSRIAVLDLKVVQDLPHVDALDRSGLIDIRVQSADGKKTLEVLGPFLTTPIPGALHLRKADIGQCFRVPRIPVDAKPGQSAVINVRLQISTSVVTTGKHGEQHHHQPHTLGTTDVFPIDRTPIARTLKLDRGGMVVLHFVLNAEQPAMDLETTLLPGSLNSLTQIVGATSGAAVAPPVVAQPPGSDPAIMGKNLVRLDNAKLQLLAAHGQERALEKGIEGRKIVDKTTLKVSSGWREWDNLDDLFSSLGTHPVVQSDVYNHLVVRSTVLPGAPGAAGAVASQHQHQDRNLQLRNRVHADNMRIGLAVERGADWDLNRYGNEDGGGGAKGVITAINEYQKTCSVVWECNPARMLSHYRTGKDGKFDLATADPAANAAASMVAARPLVCNPLGAAVAAGRGAGGGGGGAEMENIEYVPWKQIVDGGQRETLKYAAYNREQDAKVSFWDAHPGYRMKEDIWGQVHKFANPVDEQPIFVQSCVRQESFWA
ncbi:unnamed protein product [Amoebophrya sp. A120]|nr:unnamed protein product [Amoebophrya sp. A120]|eukprot:GSA120T00006377001.1